MDSALFERCRLSHASIQPHRTRDVYNWYDSRRPIAGFVLARRLPIICVHATDSWRSSRYSPCDEPCDSAERHIASRMIDPDQITTNTGLETDLRLPDRPDRTTGPRWQRSPDPMKTRTNLDHVQRVVRQCVRVLGRDTAYGLSPCRRKLATRP